MAGEGANLSQYVQTLTVLDRECYLKKLTLSDGTILPHPYVLTEWNNDVTGLPSIEWPEIYTYFIEKPSIYTKEKLRAYKSVDAYNYVLNGHVQDLQYKDISHEFCVVRGEVLPSLRQGHKTTMYQAWVIVSRTNYVFTANCTCMAG